MSEELRLTALDNIITKIRNERVSLEEQKAQGHAQRYDHHLGQVHQAIKDIQAGIKMHEKAAKSYTSKYSPTTGPHGGHVGDMADYHQQLVRLADRLHGRGEYSEAVASNY